MEMLIVELICFKFWILLVIRQVRTNARRRFIANENLMVKKYVIKLFLDCSYGPYRLNILNPAAFKAHFLLKFSISVLGNRSLVYLTTHNFSFIFFYPFEPSIHQNKPVCYCKVTSIPLNVVSDYGTHTRKSNGTMSVYERRNTI